MPEDNSKLVYSTERAVPRKEKPADRNFTTATRPAKSGTIVRLDRKGRGGKSVTVIEGLRISVKESEKLLKQLKAKLGTGGTVKDGSLEIQGDHCDAVMAELKRIGYKPKRSGG
ncbi:MAG: translation initiation factor [Thermodesulfovibrionales bacterium]